MNEKEKNQRKAQKKNGKSQKGNKIFKYKRKKDTKKKLKKC